MTLRPYQQTAIAQLEVAFTAGSRAPLLVLPTGAGKTVIAAEIIRRHVERGGRPLFLAPRRELITQAADKLLHAGIHHGIQLAGAEPLRDMYAPVQVASIDTLVSRYRRGEVADTVGVDLVIVDEAHLSITAVRQRLLAEWPWAVRIGLTATPTRKDGKALGKLFDALIEPVTTAQLTADGYLAPARYFSVSEPDLRRIGTVGGDYHQGELDKVMRAPDLVGDIVGTWLQRAPKRRTLVFGCSVAHSVELAEAFQRAGVAAEHVDGSMPTALREAVVTRFKSGRTQVLTNCFVASYGFDCPEASCIVLARPTRSLMLYLQMVGRGLRTAEGKLDCLVLDHSGNVHRFGFAADEREWTLEGDRPLIERAGGKAKERKEPMAVDCPECQATFTKARQCPECGYYLAPVGKAITTLDGELVEVGTGLPENMQERLAFYLELRGLGRERGYREGYPAIAYRERYGCWPPRDWNSFAAAMPTVTTRRWILSRNIAWRKSQENRRQA